MLYHLKSFPFFVLVSKSIQRHARRFKNHFRDTAEGLRETCHYFSMLSLQHRAYCSLISCSPCEFASTDGRIGSLEANTACILLTLSGGKSFINWDAFSPSPSLCLLPKHIIAVNKRAESECMCDLDVVMVYFPRLETLPASSSSSLVLFLSPHNRRSSNFSRCHSAEAAPLSLSLAVRPVISFHASCKCFCCSDSG